MRGVGLALAAAVRLHVDVPARAAGESAGPGWDYLTQGQSWLGVGGAPLGECAAGGQSPVDFADTPTPIAIGIGTVTDASPTRLWYRYPPIQDPLRLVNEEHTVGVTFPETYKAGFSPSDAASITDMLTSQNFFRLYKLTVHAPSEHQLNGMQFPLEIQLVHQHAVTRKNGVISVWFESAQGAHSPLLATLLEHGLPKDPYSVRDINLNGGGGAVPASLTPGTSVPAGSTMTTPAAPASGLQLQSLVSGPDGAGEKPIYYHYNGSMTEPPCAKETQWFIRTSPIPASEQQIQELSRFIMELNGPLGNARPVQQTENRPVVAMTIIDPLTESASTFDIPNIPEPTGLAVDPSTAVSCSGYTAFKQQAFQEPADVAQAKAVYTIADLDAQHASNWWSQSQSDYVTAKSLYDSAPGMVEKIQMLWDVNTKKDLYLQAQAAMEAKISAAQEVCDESLPVVCAWYAVNATSGPDTQCVKYMEAQQQSSGAANSTTTAPAAAAASNGTANATNGTAEVVTTTPLPPGQVILPGGLASNPFTNEVAENSARIGPGRMSAGYKDLTTSLKQPLMPGLPVPEAPAPAAAAPAPAPALLATGRRAGRAPA